MTPSPAGRGPTASVHGIVARSIEWRAIHQVSDIRSIVGGRQRRTRGMSIGCQALWMVERIARTVHGRSIRQVAHVVGEVRTGQRRTVGMWIRLDPLWVVHGVAGLVHGSSVWQVTNIVGEEEVGIHILLNGICEATGLAKGGPWRRCAREGRGS